ncbi:hypothetical protein KR222_004254, partial [Zaprionus bogoriensis]
VWLCLLAGSLALREHYCERNVSSSRVVPVTKQRTVVKQPSKWKLWKKAQQVTETYSSEEVQVSYKLISECCPGYKQLESGLCEPVCERGCPAHASCVAPQRCQCTPGYVSAVSHRDGSHYCEPVCERSCPSGSQCVAPQTCACKEGYRALPPTGDGVSAPCVPSCQLGDGCANGQCVDVERCICNRGYTWSMEQHRCIEQRLEDDVTELEEYLSSSSSGEVGTATTAALTASDCAEGFLLYAGECRAEFFESNEKAAEDCRQSGCGPHQTCSDKGECVCNSGYAPDEPTEQEKKELQLGKRKPKLTCSRTLLDHLLTIDAAANGDDELNVLTIPILGVATGALMVLLIAGFIEGARRRGYWKGPEPQPKEPVLQCEYTQKSYDVDEWVP